MGKSYNFRFLGGPSDGRTDRRHMSREEFLSYLDRVPKEGSPKPACPEGNEVGYELVYFKNDTFFFEWIKPQ